MRQTLAIVCLCIQAALISHAASAPAAEWAWRGPTGNGIAADGQELPDRWSPQENVLWVCDVPGRGHSSPIVADGKVFLTTADEQARTQSVLCFDLATGKRLWMTQCHRQQRLPEMHPKNTHASPSVAIGGDRAFAVFCNNDSVHVTCLDFAGQIVWQETIGSWVPAHYQFGFGQSPIFHGDKLLVTSESEEDAFVMALEPATGKQRWKIQRPEATSYGTPVVATFASGKQLLMAGGENVAGYDPDSGRQLWSTEAAWRVACGTMVWQPTHALVYASGGYPTKQTLAIKADGSGQIAWENRVKCYEQSLLVVEDCVYGYAEGGVLYCWDALTGQQLWVERLGGNESASPVLAGGKIHLTNEAGTTWVIHPNRQKFDLVATNQLGDEMFASMAVVDNRILMRVAELSGERQARQERLYCIGNSR